MNPKAGENLNSIEEAKASGWWTDLLSIISKKLEDHHKLNPEQEEQVRVGLESTISKSQRTSENLTWLIDMMSQSFKGIEDTKEKLPLFINMIWYIVQNPKEEELYKKDKITYPQKMYWTIRSSKMYLEWVGKIKIETTKQEQQSIEQQKINETEQASVNKILASLLTENSQVDYLQALQNVKNPKGGNVNIYKIYKDNIKWLSGEAISDTELNNYIAYLAQLKNKQTIGEILSDTESENLGKFESFLSSSGIEANSFFASLAQDTSNIIKDPEIIPSADSPSSLATLAEHSAYFPGLNETTQSFTPAFERQPWAKDEKLTELLPLPARFEWLRKDNPEEITNLYADFVWSIDSPARIDYPLFASIEDPQQQMSVRHLFFVSQLIDLNIIQNESDIQNLALPMRNGFPTDLAEIKKLAEQTFVPLIKEQLQTTDKLIKQESGKEYMGLLSQMMALPALSDFQVNPEEVVVEWDGLRIPYRLPGHQEVCGEITMNAEGDISISNMLYNEGDTSSTSIKIGKVSVWSAPTLKQYNQAIVQGMTEWNIKDMLASQQPTELIKQTITTSCENHNIEVQKEFDLTQAGLKQELSGSLAQDSLLKELAVCHLSAEDIQSDPNRMKLPGIRNGSPFGEELRWYSYEAQGEHPASFDAIKNPDLAKLLFPIRNSTLSFSDTENEQLASAIQQMWDLLRDPQLDKKLRNLDLADLNEKNAILYHCSTGDRKSKDWMPTLISLLCHPAPLNRQTLSLTRLDKFINQLEWIKNDSVDAASFDVPYDLHNPDFQKIIDSKDTPNLEEELSSVDGMESNETIVA